MSYAASACLPRIIAESHNWFSNSSIRQQKYCCLDNVINDEFFITEMEHCCPLCIGDHQLHRFSMQLDCLFDYSICFNTVFDFNKADFNGLRDHFSNYDDWTLLINLDINEGWNAYLIRGTIIQLME